MFDYRSVAIIVPERLGDTLFHTPSIRFLRRMRPAMRIEIVALSTLAASVFDNNPYVDAVHVEPSRQTLQQISKRCDAVMNIHNHAASRDCATALGLPCIIATPMPDVRHAAAHSQAFFEQLLGAAMTPEERRYTLFPGDEQHANIDSLLREHAVDSARDLLIGCHIGCHSIAKKGWQFWRTPTHPKVWPLEHFIALAGLMRRAHPHSRLVLTGSLGEVRLGRQLERAEPSAINLIGSTSVLELAALMNRLHAFVAPDTGTMHVACATEVALIGLFGPTDPEVSITLQY